MSVFTKNISNRNLFILAMGIAIVIALVPNLITLPFRINIYLTWEGAYRLYLGQVPYKDFGSPLGFGMWVVPWLFFEIFGPSFSSLIKAQSFTNIISALALFGILKELKVKPILIFFGVFLFSISFIIINFWPWYNHTVFVFQLIGLYFLIASFNASKFQGYAYMILAGFFMVLSFFTKQDGGAFAFFSAIGLLIVYALLQRDLIKPAAFLISYFLSLFAAILYFNNFEFSYWFNYGQEPHYSRLSIQDLLNEWFLQSKWLKFYLLFIVFYTILELSKNNDVRGNHSFWKVIQEKKEFWYFVITCLLIIGQSFFIQVTSFSPPTTHFYFFTFGTVFLLASVDKGLIKPNYLFLLVGVIVLSFWWSDNIWKYGSKIVFKFLPKSETKDLVVSKNSWMPVDSASTLVPHHLWVLSNYKTLENIKIPSDTKRGVDSLVSKYKGNVKNVLNMSELTFLAEELEYVPITGENIPLWYHQGVSFFEREVDFFCNEIESDNFDLVLFQTIPYVRDYFPTKVKACLKQNYQLVDSFLAPRIDGKSIVEVYIRKSKH